MYKNYYLIKKREREIVIFSIVIEMEMSDEFKILGHGSNKNYILS